jgi:hypothetical protein
VRCFSRFATARFESRLKLPWVKLRLIKSFVLLAIMLHWNCKCVNLSCLLLSTVLALAEPGCLHYLAASLTDFDPKSWVVRAGILDASNVVKYSFSFFDVTSLLVCSGWGIYPSGGPIVRGPAADAACVV